MDFIYILNGTAMLWHVQFARRVRGEEPQVMSHDSYPECKPCDVGDDKLLHCALGMCPWRTDAATCSTVRCKRVLGARKHETVASGSCDANTKVGGDTDRRTQITRPWDSRGNMWHTSSDHFDVENTWKNSKGTPGSWPA